MPDLRPICVCVCVCMLELRLQTAVSELVSEWEVCFRQLYKHTACSGRGLARCGGDTDPAGPRSHTSTSLLFKVYG